MNFKNQYSWLDRTIHQIAFKSYPAQVGLADIENKLFAERFQSISVQEPVFITALPRAGTTLLLETLCSIGRFASHNYRDMPFVLIPLLWDKISSRFRTDSEARERAHGDGMLVNADSPEAFEEIIWKVFWPKHYQKNSITPWKVDSNIEFEEYFKDHIRKIIALRCSDQVDGHRYISKNNLNIARVEIILKIFPDARIVIPFRHPLQHTASLLKQHNNFLALHKQDPFARKYMKAIGHFDFGENLRPVNFDRWLDTSKYNDPLSIEYWLSYWSATYKYLLKKINTHVCLVDYDSLAKVPEETLKALAQFLHIDDTANLLEYTNRIHPARPHPVNTKDISSDVYKLSCDIYAELQDLSLK